MRVDEVMTRAVLAVKGSAPLKEVAGVMARRGVSGLPVVDDDNRVLGVVSESDIVVKEGRPQRGALVWRLLVREPEELERKLQARTAGEAMTSPALTVYAHAPLAEAARLMLERGVHRLPVLDREDRLAGIVTRADLVRAFTRSDAEIAREIRDDVLLRGFWLSPESVRVEVEDGEVTVEGEVTDEDTAARILALIEAVPGVVTVRPRLTIAVAPRA